MGIYGTRTFDLRRPRPAADPSGLVRQIALAPTAADPEFPQIPRAGDDVAVLVPFLGRHLVAGEGGRAVR